MSSSSPSRGSRRSGGSVLANRDFRLYFFGNLISSSGTWLQNVAQGVLVLQITHRSAMVGAVQAATFVPIMLLALHGGQLADRFDRRKLLIGSQVLAVAATAGLAVLAATHRIGVPAIAVVAVLLGIQYAVAIPAAQAMLPGLVSREQLGEAVGYSSITYNLARAVGPLLATVAIGSLGFGLAFGLNSLSFVALAAAVAVIHLRPEGQAVAAGRGSIGEGIRYAWSNRTLRSLLLIISAISIATDPVFTLSPAFAHQVFGRATSDAGLLVAGFGGGAIVAALALGRLFRAAPARRWVVGAAGTAGMVAGMALFAVAGTFWLGIGSLVIAGMGYLLAITSWTTGLQETTSNELRGRVMALFTLCFLGTRPIGAGLDGLLADALSPRIAALLVLLPLVVAGVFLIPAARPRAASLRAVPPAAGDVPAA
ncbi:MAG TPA: hypothetical protein DIT48_13115 [Actinobacteria bacterium]|nr:hypothetical protein [Actinomycetota bacterium]HCP62652.1 hypothetical protein [Actinomycetota bacterium]